MTESHSESQAGPQAESKQVEPVPARAESQGPSLVSAPMGSSAQVTTPAPASGTVSSTAPEEQLPPPLPPLPYAGWGIRVVAYMADVFLESVGAMVLGFAGGWLAGGLIRFFDLGYGASDVMIYSQTLARGSAVAWWGVAIINRIILQWYTGGTLGKQLFGLRTAEMDGGDVHFASCVKRTILFPVSLLPFALGLMAPLWSTRKQTWHDSLARTVVLEK